MLLLCLLQNHYFEVIFQLISVNISFHCFRNASLNVNFMLDVQGKVGISDSEVKKAVALDIYNGLGAKALVLKQSDISFNRKYRSLASKISCFSLDQGILVKLS